MKHLRGGTLIGLIFGMVLGLGIALAVAVYVTKVPVPFMNKGQSRTAEQDAAEAQKNQKWDPNASLYGKNPAPAVPQATVPGMAAPAASAAASAAKGDVKAEPKPDAKVDAKTEPKPDAKADTKAEAKASKAADPLGDLVKAKTGDTLDGNAFTYWVQLGSFRNAEDAESLRAKLSLSGIETKISEREVSGKQVFRVRVGPFDKKEEADSSKDKLDKAGLETALVRVQR